MGTEAKGEVIMGDCQEQEIEQAKRANVYQENGYKNRTEYLWSLTEDHNVSIGTVPQYEEEQLINLKSMEKYRGVIEDADYRSTSPTFKERVILDSGVFKSVTTWHPRKHIEKPSS